MNYKLNLLTKKRHFMKKLTLTLVALFVAFMSFGQGNITYELNGGVMNDYGYQNKADMLVGFNQDYNQVFGIDESATWYTWETLDQILAAGDPISRIPTFATQMYELLITEKWEWLHTYILATVAEQGLPEIAAGTGGNAFLRYNVSAFFINGVRSGWPISADYAIAGQDEVFFPAWGNGWSSPTSYDGAEDVALNMPYREDWRFDGWYDNPNFTGEKLSKIAAGTEGDLTLYAKWSDAHTCKEVWAMEVGTETNVGGVVTYVGGDVAYIQESGAGLMLDGVSSLELEVGKKVVVEGTVAKHGDFIKLTDVELTKSEDGALPNVKSTTIQAILADVDKDYETFIYQRVKLLGAIVKSYDSNGYATLVDDVGRAIELRTILDQNDFKAGTKIDIVAVLAGETGVYLINDVADIEKSVTTVLDPFEYAALEDGKYTLSNKWIYSVNTDNLASNMIGSANFVRGMAAKDGKMYFIDRDLKQLTVIDGETGERLAPIKLASNIFTYEVDGETKTAGTLPYNDIKLDDAGNVLIGNCITSNAQPFQVWKINLETGEGELIVNEILGDNPDFAEAAIRFDAFGVWGDIDGDGVIMAANASEMNAFFWTVSGGTVEPADLIEFDTFTEGTLLTGLANPGTAPQVFPLDDTLFYLDGNATFPTLLDFDGSVLDGFYADLNLINDETTNPGLTYKLNEGHNGLIEFDLAGEHFFLIAASNTLGTPPSAFRLMKWKDANKEFADLETLWTFPAAGMGGATNAYRTAVPSVEVDETNGIAYLYVYTGENGYAMYEFKVADGTSVNNTFDNQNIQISIIDRTVNFGETLNSVAVYSLTGQTVANAANVNSMTMSESGIYIIKATKADGNSAVAKVIIK